MKTDKALDNPGKFKLIALVNTKKIAIATDDKVRMSSHLGRSEYFAIYTISAHEIIDRRYIENSFTPHRKGKSAGGEHDPANKRNYHSHRELIDALAGCELVLAKGIGNTLVEDLRKAGMQAYVVADEGTIDELIRKYIEGELVINRDGGCEHDHHSADES